MEPLAPLTAYAGFVVGLLAGLLVSTVAVLVAVLVPLVRLARRWWNERAELLESIDTFKALRSQLLDQVLALEAHAGVAAVRNAAGVVEIVPLPETDAATDPVNGDTYVDDAGDTWTATPNGWALSCHLCGGEASWGELGGKATCSKHALTLTCCVCGGAATWCTLSGKAMCADHTEQLARFGRA